MCNLINTHTHTHTHYGLRGAFSCDCMFRDERRGKLTRQPLGPLKGRVTMTAVMSANRVDLESFSSRCCTFRRTHTSADPIRLLCIQLALPLTLSKPSQLAPSERLRLTVGVPPPGPMVGGIFLRRKKICAGVVGIRADWTLKGEEGGITTLHHYTRPLLQYVARFDGEGEILGFGCGGYKESRPWCSLFCRMPVSFCCAKRRATSFAHVLYGDKPVHHFSRFFPHIFLRAERALYYYSSECRRSDVTAESRRSGERSCFCVWMHAHL